MNYITNNDYRVVIGDQALKVISQCSQEIRENAELQAIEEVSGYLRPAFNTNALFAQKGNDRNRQIVMYVCDIALYNMASSLPQRMGIEVRKERYERAIEWLEGVAKGQIVPNIPMAAEIPKNDNKAYTAIFGSQQKRNNNW